MISDVVRAYTGFQPKTDGFQNVSFRAGSEPRQADQEDVHPRDQITHIYTHLESHQRIDILPS